MYFASNQQLRQARQVFEDDIGISFIGDLQANGMYREREGKIIGIGHDLNEPHLKNGLLIE